MELIIFDRRTFQIKEHVMFTDTFEIKLDLVISQKSSFKVSATKLQAKLKDIVFVKTESFKYLGIIESIDLEADGIVIGTLEFKEILQKEVKAISFQGNIADYLGEIIRNTFITNTDTLENLNYLTVSKETSKLGTLNFEQDKFLKLSEIMELISKSYGVSIKEEIVLTQGKFTSICLRIVNVTEGLKIKADTLSLNDLTINQASETVVNKLEFYPKDENTVDKRIRIFYLLTDGTITEDKKDVRRYSEVSSKIKTYKDGEYETLLAQAQNELSVTRTDHQISFTVDMKNQIIRPFNNIFIGDFVEFMFQGKTYDSIVTAMSFKDSIKACQITLGEYRIKLTEKIQILSKSVNSQIGHVSISKGGFTDLDGGEF